MRNNEIFIDKLNDFKSEMPPIQSKNSVVGFLLFKDYLGKLYIWYNELGIVSQWDHNIYGTKQGHSLLHLVAPELEVGLLDIEDFRENYLNNIIVDKNKYRGFEYIFIYYGIYWEIFKDNDELLKYQYLPNPYESVLKILKRGSHILKGEMNTIEVDNLTVKQNVVFTLPSLDDNFLNYIDEQCQRIGSGGIPNQEVVNRLWDDFSLQNTN